MNTINEVTNKIIQFNAGYPELCQHLLKVHAFAHIIGTQEHLDEKTQYTLELAALVHDIGIKVCLEKYGKETGDLQEKEGPSLAKDLLSQCNIDNEIIDRITYLVGHHHTYTDINGMDYQILVEADFLVNIYENNYTPDQIQSVKEKIFKTQSGIQLLETIYK